jgi:cytochrome P450
MPPWSWWFGHLTLLQSYLNGLPPDVNVYLSMRSLTRDYSETEVFLMDLWPVFSPILMIFGPEPSIQVSNKYNLPKPKTQHKSMLPVVGGASLISMNDKDWKYWRSLFNPGFSTAVMMSRVPLVVDAVKIFCEGLSAKAGNGVFSLDDMTTRLTMDIITKAIL